jgi:very-long-chain enoyl-CoA reductase
MADKLQITIVSRAGKQLASLSQSKSSRVSALKASFQQLCECYLVPKYGPERQFFTIDTARGEALKDDKMKLEELAVDAVTLVFKDLGPQISWRLVYFIEYLGPLVIFPTFFYYPEWVWGRSADRSRTQL